MAKKTKSYIVKIYTSEERITVIYAGGARMTYNRDYYTITDVLKML